MNEAEKKKASELTHKWARHFDGQGSMPAVGVLQDLATISRYARWLEEENGRWQLEVEGYYEGAFKTKADLHTRPGWWSRFLEIIRRP